MTFFFLENQTLSGGQIGSYHIVYLKKAMKDAGWTVMSSSDGTTYNASGDQIGDFSGGSGAGGMGSSRAWFRIRTPQISGVTREFTFQVATNPADTSSWRIKYSLNGFTGGSPAATVTPSATDEVVLQGGGTDASPTFGGMFPNTGSYRCHVCVGDAAEGNFFWLGNVAVGGGTPFTGFMYEPMLSGTYPVEDVDPYVIYMNGSSGNNGGSFSYQSIRGGANPGAGQTGGVVGWLAKGLGQAGFRRIPGMMPFDSPTNLALAGNLGLNPFSQRDDMIPIMYCRRIGTSQSDNASAPYGYKGIGRQCYVLGSVSRTTGDTFSINGTRDYICFGNCALPWSGVVPII